MNPMLLVAAREFRQIAATRSFWLTLLLLPLAIVLTQVSARMFKPAPGVAYVVVDETGRYAPAIERRIRLERQRQVLTELSTYAARWKVRAGGVHALWGHGPRSFTEAEVAAFEAAGGQAAAEAELARLKPAAAPPFRPSQPRFVAAQAPADVARGQGAEAFGRTLGPHLGKDVPTPSGPRQLVLGVHIPAAFGQSGVAAQLWTTARPNAALIEAVRLELDRSVQAEALAASGVDPATLARIGAIRAPVGLAVPPTSGGREQMLIRSALPLGFAYLLLMSLMLSGSWALQGLVEERSNKLLEAVLACVAPDDLLYGKLLGVVGVGMTMILVWIAFAVGAAFAVQGAVADFLRPALTSISSPWTIAALVYFFLAGYVAISMVFLAVGVVSNSMRDAQGYLTPIILALTLPFVAVMSAVLQNPDGPLPRILSWIPPYTPFAMMARLGGGVSPLEVLGSAVLLGVFVVVELLVLGKVFRANLLQAGQPMKLKGLGRLFRAREG
ncbi:ABC transporter permease [Phenylobacterium sp.]|jgi:ABC-type Na+ efflux pump permease subunit|uniref:ABC transporter permease n=1 Tax=Phenylobacterium sp. TaxID=1871053 RepID=UPI002F95E17C